jgi:hypothetical protein
MVSNNDRRLAGVMVSKLVEIYGLKMARVPYKLTFNTSTGEAEHVTMWVLIVDCVKNEPRKHRDDVWIIDIDVTYT